MERKKKRKRKQEPMITLGAMISGISTLVNQSMPARTHRARNPEQQQAIINRRINWPRR
jgi:hypothetical protein